MTTLVFPTLKSAGAARSAPVRERGPSLFMRLRDAVRRDRQRQADAIAAAYHCDRWSDAIESDVTRGR